MYWYLITVVTLDGTNGVNEARWSSALKIHELYAHSLVMVFTPYLQHGFTWFPSYWSYERKYVKTNQYGLFESLIKYQSMSNGNLV